MGNFIEFLLLVMFIMFAAGVLQYFLNTPIEGDSWKEELREIIRQELLLGNVTPSPLQQKEE